jgi:hypothetical protein
MTTTTEHVAPHVADTIEPGAILYSSWGYDQTNIDFYYVTRTTAKSAWIVPMSSERVSGDGWTEHVVASEPRFKSNFCECRHAIDVHQGSHCPGFLGQPEPCDCSGPRPKVITPSMHRIQRDYDSAGALRLSSYSFARLWDGAAKYATHYA